MKFNKTYEQLLTEMPYIEVGEDMFDLELEQFNNEKGFKDLKKKIQNILNGKLVQDKYGNKIHLTNPQSVQEFENNLKHNFMLTNFLYQKFDKSISDLLSN